MKNVWLIGTGPMAVDYIKVLKALGVNIIVIGRSLSNCEKFYLETKIFAISGGYEEFLKTKPAIPDSAIIAVNMDNLLNTCISILEYGVKKILVEKPGVGNITQIEKLYESSKKNSGQVFIAYNRRFYASVIAAQEIIERDNGVTSFSFEFTEWSHMIKKLPQNKVNQDWFFGNSTHVIDTVFFICGFPDEITCYFKVKEGWNSNPTVYSGAGISSNNGALFSYQANWEAPGRWSIDVLTQTHRLIFKPLEKLQIQKIGSIEVNFANDINYELDENYKPGLYLQTKSFLDNDFKRLCRVEEQVQNSKIYKKMTGFNE